MSHLMPVGGREEIRAGIVATRKGKGRNRKTGQEGL